MSIMLSSIKINDKSKNDIIRRIEERLAIWFCTYTDKYMIKSSTRLH